MNELSQAWRGVDAWKGRPADGSRAWGYRNLAARRSTKFDPLNRPGVGEADTGTSAAAIPARKWESRSSLKVTVWSWHGFTS